MSKLLVGEKWDETVAALRNGIPPQYRSRLEIGLALMRQRLSKAQEEENTPTEMLTMKVKFLFPVWTRICWTDALGDKPTAEVAERLVDYVSSMFGFENNQVTFNFKPQTVQISQGSTDLEAEMMATLTLDFINTYD